MMEIIIDNLDWCGLPIYEVGEEGAITVVGGEVCEVSGEDRRVVVEMEGVSSASMRRVADVLERAEQQGIYMPAIMFKSESKEMNSQINVGVIAIK
jgi:hypothetical protein